MIVDSTESAYDPPPPITTHRPTARLVTIAAESPRRTLPVLETVAPMPAMRFVAVGRMAAMLLISWAHVNRAGHGAAGLEKIARE